MSSVRTSSSTSVTGAYGIGVDPALFPAKRLNSLSSSSPHWTIQLRALDRPLEQSEPARGGKDQAVRGHSSVDDHTAFVEMIGFNVSIDRAAATAVLESQGTPDPERLTHPCLAAIAIAAAHWSRHIALHAGAVVVDGQAWGILADRTNGKSTTMAALAIAGFPILSDDLLVIDDERRAHAGPRCVDLRDSSAALFPQAIELAPDETVASSRPRLRLATDPVESTYPLAGFIRLEWAERGVALRPVTPADRLAVLGHSFSLNAPIPNPLLALDLAALPMFALERPQRLDSLEETIAAIGSLAGRAA